MVQVDDPWLGFNQEWLMIGTVELIQRNNGRSGSLTVMPAEAYDMLTAPPEEAEEDSLW